MWIWAIVGVVASIFLLIYLARTSLGRGIADEIRADEEIQGTGEWVRVKVHALTDRGEELTWSATGRDHDHAVMRAVDALNRLSGKGTVVRVIGSSVVEAADD